MLFSRASDAWTLATCSDRMLLRLVRRRKIDQALPRLVPIRSNPVSRAGAVTCKRRDERMSGPSGYRCDYSRWSARADGEEGSSHKKHQKAQKKDEETEVYKELFVPV